MLQEHIANMLLEQCAFQIVLEHIWLKKFFQIKNGPAPYFPNGPGQYGPGLYGPGP